MPLTLLLSLDMQRKNLASGCGRRLPADDAQRLALVPDFGHSARTVVPRAEVVKNRPPDARLNNTAHPGTDDVLHPGQPVSFLLHELLICGASPKFPRQDLLHKGEKVRSKECDSLAGQLFVAAYRVEMIVEAKRPKRTGTPAPHQHAVIPCLHVD